MLSLLLPLIRMMMMITQYHLIETNLIYNLEGIWVFFNQKKFELMPSIDSALRKKRTDIQKNDISPLTLELP